MSELRVGDKVQFLGDPENVEYEIVDDNSSYPRGGPEPTFELTPVATPHRGNLDWIPARLLKKIKTPVAHGDIVEDENDSVFIYNSTTDKFYEEVYTWREGSRFDGLVRDDLYGDLKVVGKVTLEENA